MTYSNCKSNLYLQTRKTVHPFCCNVKLNYLILKHFLVLIDISTFLAMRAFSERELISGWDNIWKNTFLMTLNIYLFTREHDLFIKNDILGYLTSFSRLELFKVNSMGEIMECKVFRIWSRLDDMLYEWYLMLSVILKIVFNNLFD